MNRIIVTVMFALAATACNQREAAQSDASTETKSVDPAIYAAAVANPNRLEGDYARDAGRKPDQVLEFFGIAPGMTVLDLFSGGGYYVDLLSSVVGPGGKVIAHSNSAYLKFVGDEFKARHAEGRLANAEVLMAENNEWELGTGRFDAIMMVLSYHDSYWVSPENGWPQIDAPGLHARLFAALKPGGILAVIDHNAAPGSPAETGGTLHRIDRAIVVAELQAAGFVLDDESDLLRNPDDDYSLGVFDPAVRGKTDRYMLKFRKPE